MMRQFLMAALLAAGLAAGAQAGPGSEFASFAQRLRAEAIARSQAAARSLRHRPHISMRKTRSPSNWNSSRSRR